MLHRFMSKGNFLQFSFTFGINTIFVRYKLFSAGFDNTEMHHIEINVKNDNAIPLTKTGYRSEIFPMKKGSILNKQEILEWFYKENGQEQLTLF